MSRAVCDTCPRACRLANGQLGFCRARVARGGQVVCENYGRITSLSLDPVEKKPFYHFHPGGQILSAGSYGCNMRCPFCQNHAISQCGVGQIPYTEMQPIELAQRAAVMVPQGNIGLAFTYNEPSVGWEFVQDASKIAKGFGLVNAMVTNGCFCEGVLSALLPVVDAFNIDLKCFTEEGYRSLGGNLPTVKNTIAMAAAGGAHVEVTWLVVPGLSDNANDMEQAAVFLAGLSPQIPLHLSRYFPRWQATRPATSPAAMQALAQVAGRHLRHVYFGNWQPQ